MPEPPPKDVPLDVALAGLTRSLEGLTRSLVESATMAGTLPDPPTQQAIADAMAHLQRFADAVTRRDEDLQHAFAHVARHLEAAVGDVGHGIEGLRAQMNAVAARLSDLDGDGRSAQTMEEVQALRREGAALRTEGFGMLEDLQRLILRQSDDVAAERRTAEGSAEVASAMAAIHAALDRLSVDTHARFDRVESAFSDLAAPRPVLDPDTATSIQERLARLDEAARSMEAAAHSLQQDRTGLPEAIPANLQARLDTLQQAIAGVTDPIADLPALTADVAALRHLVEAQAGDVEAGVARAVAAHLPAAIDPALAGCASQIAEARAEMDRRIDRLQADLAEESARTADEARKTRTKIEEELSRLRTGLAELLARSEAPHRGGRSFT